MSEWVVGNGVILLNVLWVKLSIESIETFSFRFSLVTIPFWVTGDTDVLFSAVLLVVISVRVGSAATTLAAAAVTDSFVCIWPRLDDLTSMFWACLTDGVEGSMLLASFFLTMVWGIICSLWMVTFKLSITAGVSVVISSPVELSVVERLVWVRTDISSVGVLICKAESKSPVNGVWRPYPTFETSLLGFGRTDHALMTGLKWRALWWRSCSSAKRSIGLSPLWFSSTEMKNEKGLSQAMPLKNQFRFPKES